MLASLAVLVVAGVRLWQVGQFQQAGLRVGQVLVAVALLLLFVLAAGAFFSCALNFSISH